MAKQWKSILVVCLVSLLTTGCWDRIEIEERGFVVGAAIDAPKSAEVQENAEEEAPNKPKGKQRFVLTQQFVNPAALGAEGSGGGGFINVTSEGESMFEITREVAAKTSRSPFLEHIKIIVISEEVAKSAEFAHVIDFFLRFPESRRGSHVLISKGEAKEILKVDPKNEKIPAMYIMSISKNNFKNARMLPVSRLGDLNEDLLYHRSYTIQRITGKDQEVKIAGNAIFHGHSNKLIGYLGEEETEGLNFLTGEVRGGLLKAKVEDNLVVYNIEAARHKVTVDVDDKENMTFTVSIDTEGNIAESFVGLDYLDPAVISKVEQKVAEEIERLANDTIQKVHEEFKVDVLELGSYLKQEHHAIWQQVEDEWDHGKNYFAQSKIKVKAKVIVRGSGSVNKTER